MGQRIGAFELGEEIGAGGMGRVYRARDTKLGRAVAVKVLAEELRRDPERWRRFEDEAKAVAALSHPNVVSIFDHGIAEDTPYLVCELLEGETLRERLRGGALPWRKAVELAAQIAAGLAAAHAAGIVHRDLKPGNVFVTRDGRIKIIDFGVARAPAPAPQGESTVSGTILGTAGYMAPEQVRGEPADARADIFALGVVLYEMLAGAKAFSGATDVERGASTLRDEPADLPSSVPGPVVRVVRRCLEKRAAERFESARDLGFALEALLEASATGGSKLQPRRGSRRRLVIAAALIGAVAVGGVAGWLTHGPRRSHPATEKSPTFIALTFRRGFVSSARFAAAAGGVVYAASWDGAPTQTYLALPGHSESRELYPPGPEVLAISASQELALREKGGLARASLAGGEPRVVLDDVTSADWIPGTDQLAITRNRPGHHVAEFPAGHPVFENVEYLEQIRVSPDGSRIAVTARDNGADDLVIVGKDGSKRVLLDNWGVISGFAWAPGGELWVSGTPGTWVTSQFGALYAVDAGGRHRTLLEGPVSYVLHDVSSDRRCLVSSTSFTERAAGRRGDAGESELTVFDSTKVMGLSAAGDLVLVSEHGAASEDGFTMFTRRLDVGAPAVKLIDSLFAYGLSPDGSQALAYTTTTTRDLEHLMLVPIGAGTSRDLPNGPIVIYKQSAFFPDGHHLLHLGIEAGPRVGRLYVQDLDSGAVRRVSEAGVGFDSAAPVSSDGTWALAREKGVNRVVSLGGAPPRDIPGIQLDDELLGWTSDGRVFVMRPGRNAATISTVDLTTGAWTDVKVIAPADRAGTNFGDVFSPKVLITPDGKTYVYSYQQNLSRLYLVDGLR